MPEATYKDTDIPTKKSLLGGNCVNENVLLDPGKTTNVRQKVIQGVDSPTKKNLARSGHGAECFSNNRGSTDRR